MAPNNGYPDEAALRDILKQPETFFAKKLEVLTSGLAAAKDAPGMALWKFLQESGSGLLVKLKTQGYAIGDLSEKDREAIIKKLSWSYPCAPDSDILDFRSVQ